MVIRHLGALAHDQELILIALVVGMAASGTILLSAVPSAALSYMSVILIPSAVKCFILLDHRAYLLLGALVVSYWGFLAALISKVVREISERKLADVALRESETRLQEALTAGQVVAFTWHPRTGQSHRSENAQQILGIGPEASADLPGNEFLARVHPHDRRSSVAQLKALCPENTSYSTAFRFTRPDGQPAWFEETGKAEFDADGRYVRLRGLTRDISERKQAEEKLQKSESEARKLLAALAERTTQLALAEKSALVGSFAYDVGTEKLQVSAGYAAIHGFPNETRELARSKWQAGVHSEDRVRLDELRDRAFGRRSPEYAADFRFIRPGGDVRWIEGRAFVDYHSDGSPRRVVGVDIDVTERKRAEVAREESEARYRALYDDNPSMYFTVAICGTVLSVNEFGARQLGYTPAELVGQSVLRVVYEEDHELSRRHLASCAEDPEAVATTELRKVRRDGSVVWVREVARAVRGSAEQRTVLLIVCEDITERKRAESQQNLLVAELDHRVKNVLASVAVVAHRTAERSGSTSDFIEALDDRLQSMAEAHSLLSRNRWQGVSLANVINQELAPFATSSNTMVEGPDVSLTAAATQAIAMVLHELTTNAAKYGALSSPQGLVSVRWSWQAYGCTPAMLELAWHERGGPIVAISDQTGYGTSVIRDLIPYELGGQVSLVFAREGVCCRIGVPPDHTIQGVRENGQRWEQLPCGANLAPGSPSVGQTGLAISRAHSEP
jgi:PAS domain S-box-containing protein